jgi:hypothetical protein
VFLSFLRSSEFPRGYNIRAYCSVDGVATSQIVHNTNTTESNEKKKKDTKETGSKMKFVPNKTQNHTVCCFEVLFLFSYPG